VVAVVVVTIIVETVAKRKERPSQILPLIRTGYNLNKESGGKLGSDGNERGSLLKK